jgi:hypothetical protein
VRSSLNQIPESAIVADLLALLQGGTGNRIAMESGGVRVDGLLARPHSFVLTQLLRVVNCLAIVSDTVPQLKGVVGQSIADGLQKTRREFILALSAIQASETSLLSLLAVVTGSLAEKMYASAVICRAIVGDSEESVINALALTQSHGNKLVQSIAADLLRLGIAVLVDFVKEWVVYGRLDDPYGEFFVARSDNKVETWDWWNSKFVVVSHRIPLFLVEENMIAEIVASGRAWNFVRKFKTVESGFPSEGNYEGREFSLRLVNTFYSEAMRYAMRILMESVWISGHLRTLHDFILFFRGDFASTLFSILSNERWAESLNLLAIPLQACAPGSSYTNKETGEKLTDRIDLQIKTALDHASMKLSYRVDSPLDTLFDPESLANYRKLSQFLWRFKCCEYHLTAGWRKAKRQQILSLIGDHSNLSRRQNMVRHRMLTTIRAFNEFFSTDVVLSGGRILEAQVPEIHDIDTLIRRHHLHVNGLMKGTFLTDEFLAHRDAIGRLVQTVDLYAELEDEIDTLIDRMLDRIEDSEDFADEGDTLIRKFKAEVEDVAHQVSQLGHEFDDRLDAVYALASRKEAQTELQRLEVRLKYCIGNPVPQKPASARPRALERTRREPT